MTGVLLVTDGDHRMPASGSGHAAAPGTIAGVVALATELATAGHDVEIRAWLDPATSSHRADLVIVGAVGLEVSRREGFLGWSEGIAARATVWNPTDVLRWSSHRSYLLELEERGAPVVPTAWTARGDRIDLAALLTARGWPRAALVPASQSFATGPAPDGEVVRGDEDGQRRLDALLADDDVAIRRAAAPDAGPTQCAAVTVVWGRPLGAVVWSDASPSTLDDAELAALAAWVVEATRVTVPLARVVVERTRDGGWELLGLDTLAPLHDLARLPDAVAGIVAAVTAGARH